MFINKLFSFVTLNLNIAIDSQDAHEVSPDGLLGVVLVAVRQLLLVVRQLLRDLVQLLGAARIAFSRTLCLMMTIRNFNGTLLFFSKNP